LPGLLASRRIRSQVPDVSVSIVRAGNDAVRVGSPIDRGDKLVVLFRRKHSEDQFRKRLMTIPISKEALTSVSVCKSFQPEPVDWKI
jgi:hypothetical protein